jgi:Flp pilus assembly protein TadD
MPARPGSGNHALERAVVALRMQQPHEAERLAAGVLRSNRSDILAAQILGRALLMQGRPAEAIAPLERAARRFSDAETETLLAMALAASGRDKDALEQLSRTTARRPSYPPAFLEHAGLLSKKGRFEEAVTVLEDGLSLAPDSIELRMKLGFMHLKRNDRAKAREMMSQALASGPARPDILAALAKMMVMDGEYAAAADHFRRALGLRPDDAVSRNNLGACLLEMNQREAGEASLRAAARSAPQMSGMVMTSLASASHGRFFLRPSDAAKFLKIEKS